MQQTLEIGNTKWIYLQELTEQDVGNLAKEYNLHEVIVDDLTDKNAQSKIDVGSENFFLSLTFTKYSQSEERYLMNELDVIIGHDYIITTTTLESESLKNLFENLKKELDGSKQSYKTSPYYILYRIIDVFYDKTIKSFGLVSKKLNNIQDNIVTRKVEKDFIEDLLNEDLNKIFIKHNFLSQEDVVADLIDHVDSFHEKHLKVYFNSLQVKLTKIISTINVLSEKNDSLMAAYNTFVGIKNNDNVTRLTFVNAIFLPLMLIAGIGGMSEWSMITGIENWRIAYPAFILICIGVAGVSYYILRKFFLKK